MQDAPFPVAVQGLGVFFVALLLVWVLIVGYALLFARCR